jgi:hypothetical protein
VPLAVSLVFLAFSPFSNRAACQASEPTCVHFDVPQAIACQPIDRPNRGDRPHATAPVSNDQIWVEAVFDVSTLIRFGDESRVEQLLLVIENPTRSLRVADFAPRTELTTAYLGHLEKTRQQDQTSSSGFSATLNPHPSLSAQANASGNTSSSETLRYQQLPPMELLAASGTAARGTAVYYKFRANSQTTLEGLRTLQVIFDVPRNWRADYVFVRCVAYASSPREQAGTPICGSADFLVPVYLAGDEDARQAAFDLSRAERELRSGALQYRTETVQGGSDELATKFVSLFRSEKRSVPNRWLTDVLTSMPMRREFSFQRDLPEPVSEAVSEFTRARWEFTQLNRGER